MKIAGKKGTLNRNLRFEREQCQTRSCQGLLQPTMNIACDFESAFGNQHRSQSQTPGCRSLTQDSNRLLSQFNSECEPDPGMRIQKIASTQASASQATSSGAIKSPKTRAVPAR